MPLLIIYYLNLDLEEENRRLREDRLCKICCDEESGVVVLPCAHLATCKKCVSNLAICPLCRKTINAIIHIIIS